MSYKNNQPVMVCNTLDVETGEFRGALDNSATDIYGDYRPNREGRALLGDGIMYITIIGLLATDTYTVNANSNGITISNGRIDIANGDKVFELKIYRSGVLIGVYNLEEESGSVLVQSDTSLTLPNGTLINSSPSNFTTQNFKSYANDVGYTLSDGATYYYNNDDTGLIPINVIIPRDESNPSKCCAYLSGGAQADLQYKGKYNPVMKVTGSPALKINSGVEYLRFGTSIPVGATVSYQESDDSTLVSTITGTDITFTGSGTIWDLIIDNSGVQWCRLAMCNYSPNTTIYDIGVVGGTPTNNDATLLNSSPSSFVTQDVFHYLQNGFSNAFYVIDSDHGWGSVSQTGAKILETRIKTTDQKFMFCGVGGSWILLVQSTDNDPSRLHGAGITADIYIDDVLRNDITTPSEACIALCDNMTHNLRVIIRGGVSNLLSPLSYFNSGWYYTGYVYDYYIYDVNENLLHHLKAEGIVPALEDMDDTEALGGILTTPKGGFLNTGETIIPVKNPELIQADINNNVLFDVSGNPIAQTFASFTTNNLINNQYFNDVSTSNKVTQIRAHKDNLTTEQINTDKRITNN